MACIFFFSIPAHGHVNPTLPLVRELTARGHRVLYYNVEAFREKIESSGAAFMPADRFMPPAPGDLDRRVGKDFASLIEMMADVTVAMDAQIGQDVSTYRPSCVVGDSVCIWGKLLARKYRLPFICSTTTLAFNEQTAGFMKQSAGEILRLLLGMPRIAGKLALLRAHGHDVSDIASLMQNDRDTATIVYTSRLFQPLADTFGSSYAFVGPLVMKQYPRKTRSRPLVYISLGTVLHHAPAFYRSCIRAISGMDWDAVISIGDRVDPAALGALPANISVFPRVNQLEILAEADVFLTHCGMNSVSESLLCGVPMVLFPQHSEETAVAGCVQMHGAGLKLKRSSSGAIRAALSQVLHDPAYRAAAQKMAEDFAGCGGAEEAADFIEARMQA